MNNQLFCREWGEDGSSKKVLAQQCQGTGRTTGIPCLLSTAANTGDSVPGLRITRPGSRAMISAIMVLLCADPQVFIFDLGHWAKTNRPNGLHSADQ